MHEVKHPEQASERASKQCDFMRFDKVFMDWWRGRLEFIFILNE